MEFNFTNFSLSYAYKSLSSVFRITIFYLKKISGFHGAASHSPYFKYSPSHEML